MAGHVWTPLQQALIQLEEKGFKPPDKVLEFIYNVLRAAGFGTPSGPPGGGGGEC